MRPVRTRSSAEKGPYTLRRTRIYLRGARQQNRDVPWGRLYSDAFGFRGSGQLVRSQTSKFRVADDPELDDDKRILLGRWPRMLKRSPYNLLQLFRQRFLFPQVLRRCDRARWTPSRVSKFLCEQNDGAYRH